MNILNTKQIKENLTSKLKSSSIDNTLHILAMNPSDEELAYKNYIKKRCDEFSIKYAYKEFDLTNSKEEILSYINKFSEKDGFILLLPFGQFDDIDYLRENILLKDIDGFTYKSMGYVMNGELNYLPATPKAVVKFLEENQEIVGANIVIANRTNLIGLPLSNYLINKGATVTVLNSKTKNPKCHINNADIFITAVGKAKFYDRSYFKDGQTIIDVGTSLVNGKIEGDVDYMDLEDLDIKVLTSKNGIGAITTLTLLQSLID
ncbi:bifunctional 5,10-methylenetetrahydrofolate dehydrogenase/5,10-methenyltetrahydrofolate cyclohydrolase [Anaerococcus sp.]|uniref:bifunctional 5,10-methylenetetrahydrofolate dehydrogenase/5,10-methenyltetrahydrofolate cyclohydrolase n=1 Tax=Anaerococcus sp. TaxID=1872515 RepID=UPI0028FE8FB3|nr:bifunctional 5,10-methylenetetrahydrofolate dehydrogenase/5,10-methenyltetrahydrofolate cyclohydrolase [Anaerococcus sp.]MDU2599158.1 bifunctional 5,10-methylenetetrahydrofolate dehydrogenase/5,10-methenyltetrahydrofolate cyclohydrolase [Anaerococcus sp.]MDU5230428.1 bifunctional 5,10-methylenetetrahydrofolate dehydrogenase/5,10-methenyltetrahydrofolate cyclohydrolase [Anaerococcus sp.]